MRQTKYNKRFYNGWSILELEPSAYYITKPKDKIYGPYLLLRLAKQAIDFMIGIEANLLATKLDKRHTQ